MTVALRNRGRRLLLAAVRCLRRVITALAVAVGLVAPALGSTTAAAQDSSADAAALPKVLLVGDSVLEGICLYSPAELDTLRRTFAVTCEGTDKPPFHFTSDGPALIRSHADDFDDHLVIALGYNDGYNAAVFKSRAQAILQMPEVRATTHVFWLTLRNVNGNYGAANQVLRELDAAYPNLTLLDWHAVSVAERRIMTLSDGVHLTEAGRDAMANLITGALNAVADPKLACRAPSGVVRSPNPASARGYYLLDSAGRVHGYGDAPLHGDVRNAGSAAVSMQTTASGDGYWITTADGRVHAFGGAVHHGDMPSRFPALRLAGPVRRLEPHPSGQGYWLMGSDGGIFAFGPDARFFGSVPGVLPPGRTLWGEIISIAATARGDGYFLIGEDGGVFTFGGARFLGSVHDRLPAGRSLDRPIVSLAVHPRGAGYWLYAADGGIFSFGAVGFFGSVPGLGLCRMPATVAMRPSETGNGYWVVTDRGWVIPFGDAVDHGGDPALGAGVAVIDMAVR
jgi:hypothetical protein